MGRYSVKRYKTKRRTRDLDLIHDDISNKETIHKLKNQPLDETKPGLGQYYCIECAKYFENQISLDRHNKGKIHKRRVKELKARPYTPLEAEAAGGVNMIKFLELVEKYKQLEAYKSENQDEFEQLKRQKKDTLDAIITGIPSEQLEQMQAEQYGDKKNGKKTQPAGSGSATGNASVSAGEVEMTE